ncbi:MAG: FAD-binding oxidoreductase [Nanoarchaeota archaeon]|nr:FAD-binding oxidoreductase [Nanoarchaeota archaeon]
MIKLKSKDIVYRTDASQIIGNPLKVVIPKTINEVTNIVRLNQKIIPRGGGTGLVGGCVPNEGVVIDLSKLNKIIRFDERRKKIEVETGIVLDDLNEFLDNYSLEFPVKPSSHEVCTIGGMIATDAVGSRAIKYGKTSKWIEWIEIIDSQGKIIRKGKAEISDFTGLEGITGIIIRASLKLSPKVKRSASIISREEISDIIDIVREIRLNSEISMIEFFDKKVSGLLGLEKKYNLLIEYESDSGELKGDAYNRIMSLRDSTYPILAEKGYSRIEDPRMFLDKISDLIFWLEANKIPTFGHLGVGILHPCFSKEQEKKIPDLMRIVKRLRGQVTGEHGIGLLKKNFLDKTEKKLYESVKKRNDPKNKFNPEKII